MFLFMLLVFKRNALRLLNNRWIVFIGVASYGLYLIHENIGLWLIMHIGSYMGNAATILPLLVTVAMVSFSLALFKYFEKPVSRFLKNHWVAGKLQKSPLVSVEGAKSAD